MISIKDIKEKYKDKLIIDLVELVKNYDPTKNNRSSQFKFTKWYLSLDGEAESLVEIVLENIKEHLTEEFNKECALFDELCKENFIENKDIFTYKSLDDFNVVLEEGKRKKELKSREKEIKKFFENDEWLICTPLTWESSCIYGASTKWCTASKGTRSHFDSYTKNGGLIYLLNKKDHDKKSFGIHLNLVNCIERFKPLYKTYQEKNNKESLLPLVVTIFNEATYWNVADSEVSHYNITEFIPKNVHVDVCKAFVELFKDRVELK